MITTTFRLCKSSDNNRLKKVFRENTTIEINECLILKCAGVELERFSFRFFNSFIPSSNSIIARNPQENENNNYLSVAALSTTSLFAGTGHYFIDQ